MAAPTSLNIDERRKAMDNGIDAAIASMPLSPKLDEFWIEIPTRNGWLSRTKIIKPKKPSSSPLIILITGGGFKYCNPAQVTRPAREFAETFGACVACPSYREVPEARFPIAAQDVYDVVHYLSFNAEKQYAVDFDAGFIVAGVSAGGLIAAAIGGISANAGTRGPVAEIPDLKMPVTGVWLSASGIFTEDIVPDEYRHLWTSREENEDNGPLTGPLMDLIISDLQPDSKSYWFSPAYSLTHEKGQTYPPTYFQVCGLDVLRDDGVVFEKMLKGRGIKTKIDLFPEDGHSSWIVGVPEQKSRDPSFEEGTLSGMRWLLENRE